MGIEPPQGNPATGDTLVKEATSVETSLPASQDERRAFPRYPVDCPATVTPISGVGAIAARMLDLSFGGCRLSTAERLSLSILTRVEVSFQLRGLAFRIVGVTTGTRSSKSFAIRFLDLPPRRASELTEAIAELATLPPPAPVAVLTQQPLLAARPTSTSPAELPPPSAKSAPQLSPPTPALSAATKKTADSVNRRSHNRHAVDTRVNLTLIKSAICMPGSILNLSQGGCRLRTDERFNVGIYTRVEAQFFLHGLPFRLAGVSQAIMDRNTIGVRFLDMSERKREQLTELIAEIAADQPNLTDTPHPPDPEAATPPDQASC